MSDFTIINSPFFGRDVRKPSDDGLKFNPKTRVKFVSKASSHCDTRVYVDGKPLSLGGKSGWIAAGEIKERVRIFHALGYHDHDQGYKVVVDQSDNYDVRYHLPTQWDISQRYMNKNKYFAGNYGINMALQQKRETIFRITDVSGKIFVVSGSNKPAEKIQLAVSDDGTFDITSIKIEDLDGVKVIGFYWLNPNHSDMELPLNFNGRSLYGFKKFTPDQLPVGGFNLEKVGYGGRLLISVTDGLNKDRYLMGSIDRSGYLALD